MHLPRGRLGLGLLAAAALLAASPVVTVADDEYEPVRRRRDPHKPSGSMPVPGGGARERERALLRVLAKKIEQDCIDGAVSGCEARAEQANVRLPRHRPHLQHNPVSPGKRAK